MWLQFCHHDSFLHAQFRKTTLKTTFGTRSVFRNRILALTPPRLVVNDRSELPLSGSARSQHEYQARGGVSPRLADLDTVQHQQHAHQ